MSSSLSRFCKDEAAATPIEYGVMAALVAILIVGTLRLIGAYLSRSFGGHSSLERWISPQVRSEFGCVRTEGVGATRDSMGALSRLKFRWSPLRLPRCRLHISNRILQRHRAGQCIAS